jgi:hypothetical protein
MPGPVSSFRRRGRASTAGGDRIYEQRFSNFWPKEEMAAATCFLLAETVTE